MMIKKKSLHERGTFWAYEREDVVDVRCSNICNNIHKKLVPGKQDG
jgi:hypothetical protein